MRQARLLTTALVFLLILNGGLVYGQTKNRTKMPVMGSVGHPDLVVNQVQVVDGCKLKITLKNIGTAGVPDSAYGSSPATSVQFRATVDGSPFISGWLDVLDSAKALKRPGAYSHWTWTRPLPAGTKTVLVEIDTSNKLAEANETNNSYRKTYTCGPDLVVNQVQVVDGCKLKITLKNIGTAGVPDSAYGSSPATSVQFRATVDGSPFISGWLDTLDSARALKTPGAYSHWTWTSPLPAGSKTVLVEIDTSDKLAEASETNNSYRKTYTCGPDLVVNQVQVVDGCKLKITLKNIGTAGVPDSAYGSSPATSVQFRATVDGTPFISSWLETLDSAKALKTPGAYSHWTWTRPLPAGTKTVLVEIDTSDKLAEVNETNNSYRKAYTCTPE